MQKYGLKGTSWTWIKKKEERHRNKLGKTRKTGEVDIGKTSRRFAYKFVLIAKFHEYEIVENNWSHRRKEKAQRKEYVFVSSVLLLEKN